jgi:hypothetical protein
MSHFSNLLRQNMLSVSKHSMRVRFSVILARHQSAARIQISEAKANLSALRQLSYIISISYSEVLSRRCLISFPAQILEVIAKLGTRIRIRRVVPRGTTGGRNQTAEMSILSAGVRRAQTACDCSTWNRVRRKVLAHPPVFDVPCSMWNNLELDRHKFAQESFYST